MAKNSSKSAAAIQRLLEERRQYEAWLARIKGTADSTPEHVRTRVRADYEARLKAVTEELKAHADAARQLIAQRKETLLELQKKEKAAAERLAETELRHEVGEYDEGQWAQVHKDALADLGAVRDELMDVERDITRLEELDQLVKAKPSAAPRGVMGELTMSPSPAPAPPAKSEKRKTPMDELAFLKSVTDDAKSSAPSPQRASGAQYQINENATPDAPANADVEPEKTHKCRECGTMNVATEWYCENCGAELASP
jgi:hypothetical protein